MKRIGPPFLIVVCLAACISSCSCASGLVYFPDTKVTVTPAVAGLAFQAVRVRTADKVTIAAWWLPHEAARATVLFCHGNAGNISHRLDQLKIFHGLGLNVLIFDYRGYGESEGSPSEEGTRRDAEAAWEWCTGTMGISPRDMIIYGHSLGGAVAVRLASEKTAAGLIVDSSFTSVADVASRHVPGVLARGLFGGMYDSRETIARVRCPVLVMHSPEDEIIPYEMGEELFRVAREPKRFFKSRGSHNSAFIETGPGWGEAIGAFIEGAAVSK
ncbi:MAG: alpha/beta hydrolase [Spirochaetes bacterium]|nr:MAG: alpha/beta hydrolase [Spirochaetota bacterium]